MNPWMFVCDIEVANDEAPPISGICYGRTEEERLMDVAAQMVGQYGIHEFTIRDMVKLEDE